jgi:hypothetical protein
MKCVRCAAMRARKGNLNIKMSSGRIKRKEEDLARIFYCFSAEGEILCIFFFLCCVVERAAERKVVVVVVAGNGKKEI